MRYKKCMKRLLIVVLVIAAAFIVTPLIGTPVYAEDGGLTLELTGDSNTFYEGDPVNVKATGDPNGQKNAWVGLYYKGEEPGSVFSLRWYYIGAHEGEEVNIIDKYWEGDRPATIRKGDYSLFLFGSDGYDIVKKIDFSIVEDPNTEPASPDNLSLEVVDGKTSFVEGEPINVKASGDPSDTLHAWVGLYKRDEVPGSGVYSLRWYYISAHEGEAVNIADSIYENVDRHDAVNVGEYTLIMFSNDSYDIAKKINITVTEDPDKEPAEPSDVLDVNLIEPEKTTYKQGEPVLIRATGVKEGAWVGLYKADETPAVTTPSLRWFYIQDGYNGVKVDITSSQFIVNNSNSITEGDYKILLYDADNYDNLVKQINFKIEGIIDVDPDEFSIETDKTEYAYKESIKVKASGTGIGNGAWVGLYPADTVVYSNSYLYYYYVREANGSWVIIQNKNKGAAAQQYVGDGKYKLVIFADPGYNYPIKTVEITVTRDLKYRKVIREPGCTTLGVEYVTYEDDTSEYRPVPTLGGHLWGDPVPVSGSDKHKYICERDEDHVKTEACHSSAAGEVVNAATLDAAGKAEYVCDVCGNKYARAIPKIAAKPKLSRTNFVYNKKNQKPAVGGIFDENDNAIDKSMYTITYPKVSRFVGTYPVTVKFKGNYSGAFTLKYVIVPAKIKIKKVKAGKNAFRASWKKATAQTTGYQVAYSLNKKFKKCKYKKVKGVRKTAVKVGKLKAKKKYYVKVRAYKLVKGKAYYSAWSAVKAVRIKK